MNRPPVPVAITLCASALLCLTASAMAADPDPVVATVNGEALTQRRLHEAIPPNLFGPILKRVKTRRLEVLIDLIKRRQFLKKLGITVPDSEIDPLIADYRKTPPVAPCSCCRYASFDAFLQDILLTEAEYREKLKFEIGLEMFLHAQWKERYPDARAIETALAPRRKEFEAGYVRFSAIRIAPGKHGGEEKAAQEARNAYRKISEGSPIESVGTTMEKALPTVRFEPACARSKLSLTPEEIKGLQKLAPGDVSGPVRFWDGWTIFKRETLTEADLVFILRDEFNRRNYLNLLRRMEKETVVERK